MSPFSSVKYDMCCLHRFLDFHQIGLFPTWNVQSLFIGTFNPSWNKPGNNADYYYGRSNYFWKILPRFYDENSLHDSSREERIGFCQRKMIGFTDLIKSINGADFSNQIIKRRILSFKDRDLLTFDNNLVFNTPEILDYITNNGNLERVFFTLLGENVGAISENMELIEQHCVQCGIQTHRLHTHTGQRLRGTPRVNALTNRWFNQGLNFINPNMNLNAFPFNVE